MRVTETLVRVAALAAAATAGCGCSSGSSSPYEAPGCGGGEDSTLTVTAAQACEILDEAYAVDAGTTAPSTTCAKLCGAACVLPPSFISAVQSLNPDAGTRLADAGPRMLECPTSPATMTMTCFWGCAGRLTEGYQAPHAMRDDAEGLAARSYLEAVSVHAFDRLASELAVHRAPAHLQRAARRARRDELRHTAMIARLARKRGGFPRLPEAPTSWAMPRLRANERLEVERAMKNAITEIAARDPRTASLLFS